MSSESEFETSFTATAFLGLAPWRGTELYFDPEAGAGKGISATQGIAAFPNGEIYRVGVPGLRAYVSRIFVRQIIGLGGEQEELASDQNQLAEKVDVSRVVINAGRFSLNDFLDTNSYAHDPRTQFLNWGLMDNGAWDYAADTRGYTYGAEVELNQPRWAARAAVVMVPTTPNGAVLDTNLLEAQGTNLELEYRYARGGHPGKARLLGYRNRAFMGSYAQTIANPQYAMDISQSRAWRERYGVGLNLEQEITADLGAFARLGWNDGQSETWAFTEIDRSASAGVSMKGDVWHRGDDTTGAAVILSGLSNEHRRYLALGGHGFMLGGGLPSYALEVATELYYRYQVITGISATLDWQEIFNPGYRADRGPATVFSGRLHLQL